jgi:hypothetical protein
VLSGVEGAWYAEVGGAGMLDVAAVAGVGVGAEITRSSAPELLILAKRFNVLFRKLIDFDMAGRLLEEGADEGEIVVAGFSVEGVADCGVEETLSVEEELLR